MLNKQSKENIKIVIMVAIVFAIVKFILSTKDMVGKHIYNVTVVVLVVLAGFLITYTMYKIVKAIKDRKKKVEDNI